MVGIAVTDAQHRIAQPEGGIGSVQGAVIGGLALRAPAINAPAVQQVSSGSDSGMAGLILNALSQMRVQIDGHDAGQIMLPTLEELIGEQTISRRYEA